MAPTQRINKNKPSVTSPLIYNTRDAKGNDITKEVALKTYDAHPFDFNCSICQCDHQSGIPVKSIVSSNFTDWAFVGEYICTNCASLFSLFPYSYIITGFPDARKIRLLNVREMADEILRPQETPFMTVISISQKKHLFYKATTNYNADSFIANLEEEQISCELSVLREQFAFIGALQVLGESKLRLKEGVMRSDIALRMGMKRTARAFSYLNSALKTRQIQMPLHLSQKPIISEEEALCSMDSILNQ